jgi:hypothetical protein
MDAETAKAILSAMEQKRAAARARASVYNQKRALAPGYHAAARARQRDYNARMTPEQRDHHREYHRLYQQRQRAQEEAQVAEARKVLAASGQT